MGSAQIQGEIWGARADDWAEANEPAWQQVYRAVLAQAGVRRGTRLIDIGCGAGGALVAACQLGAEVTGLDASENLVRIAQSRLPSHPIKVGEMEELPFDDEKFDAVTAINSLQFAGNIVRALHEAKRVCRRDATVTVLVWGKKEDCELISTVLPPVLALLPPPSAEAPPPLPLAEPGVIERVMRQAGLSPTQSTDLVSPLLFPDRNTAERAIMSAMARPIRHAGDEAVRRAVTEGLTRLSSEERPVKLKSRFRPVTARA